MLRMLRMQSNKNLKISVSLLAACFCLLSTSAEAKLKLEKVGYGASKGNFLFENDPRALVSSVQLVFHTGSAHDLRGKEGLTALAFDSILRGTTGKSRDAFAAAIEGLGATIQAGTRYDRTEVSLYTISENLEAAIRLLAEAILEPAIRPEEFSQLKGEHLAKLNQTRSRTTALLFRAFRAKIFNGTSLAHSPDGTIRSVESISRRDIRPFLSRHINADNVAVAVNTNVNEAKVRAWLEKYFRRLPKGAPAPTIKIKAAQKKGRHLLIFDRKSTTTISTIVGHFSYPSTYNRSLEADIGNFVLGGGGMVSRLFDELRNKKGWTYGASSGHYLDSPRKYGSVFTLYTFPAAEYYEKAIPKAVEIYENFVKNGVSRDEFKLAKKSMGNSYAFSFANASSRMSNRLYEFIDGSPFLSVSKYRDRLAKLTRPKLNRVIRNSFEAKNLFIAVAGDKDQLVKLKDKIPGVLSVTILQDPIESL